MLNGTIFLSVEEMQRGVDYDHISVTLILMSSPKLVL